MAEGVYDTQKGKLRELRQMGEMKSGQKDIKDTQTTDLHEI